MKKTCELLTDEVVTRLDEMIRKIAMRKRNTVVIEYDELVNELWVKALDVIEKRGEIDYNYIAKACFFGIVDIVRRNVKDESFPCTNQTFDQFITRDQKQEQNGDHSSAVYTYSSINENRFQDAEQRIIIEDILNLFNPESEQKERAYVKAWMDILGLNESIECPENLPEKAYDRYIAVEVLHYAGSGSGGYMKLRRKVREKLADAGYKL